MPKSKSKKQKTHHHHQHQSTTNANGALSHEEIWDDSALVRSWNDAVAEYEYYHSIHARGEDVDEVLRRAEGDEETAREALRGLAENVTGGGVARQGMGRAVNVNGHDAVGGGERDDESADEGEIEDDRDDGDVIGMTGTAPAMMADAAAMPPSPLPPLNTQQPRQRDDINSTAPAPTSAPTKPQGATAPPDSADQTLENIKMAYYWAGYYSGLYDGQQQAQAQGQGQAGARG
ncbi:hypothetical protein PMZ80_009918 [Knufia obscura]|uniref:Survival Motor Neuron Gemin2-binding domain-containing protein n=1 Tax=Knufia obscura TaxID=1635080 RepID=A0ABR0RC51_9EURO|nr:hypothetical protein PMZ80_009918 [Knufia obscura]